MSSFSEKTAKGGQPLDEISKHSVVDANDVTSDSLSDEGFSASGFRGVISKHGIVIFTLLGAALGVGAGLGLLFGGVNNEILLQWIGLPGTIFMRALTCMIVPLVFSSLVTSVANAGSTGGFKKIGGVTIAMYTATTIFGALEGLALGYAARPAWQPSTTETDLAADSQLPPIRIEPSTVAWDSLARVSAINSGYTVLYDTKTAARVALALADNSAWNTTDLGYHQPGFVDFRLPDLLPLGGVTNVVVYDASGNVAFQVPDGSLTVVEAIAPASESSDSSEPQITSTGKQVSDSIYNLIVSLVPRNAVGTMVGKPNDGAALLPMIMFAIAFGIGLGALKKAGHGDLWQVNTLESVLSQTLAIVLWLIGYIMYITPVAVFSLITKAIAENSTDTLLDTLSSIGVLLGVTVAGFTVHIIVVYGLLSLVLISRYNPLRHFAQFAPAYSISFGSASSASTLPTTMKCAEDAGLTKTIYQFVLSLGATVNMDGNAIFYPTVVLWLADQAGYHVGLADSIQIVIVATLSSMGASPTPGLTPAIILVWSTCFPQYPVPDAIAYCMALDWLLDRLITTLNVAGDTVAARSVEAIVKGRRQDDIENTSTVDLNTSSL